MSLCGAGAQSGDGHNEEHSPNLQHQGESKSEESACWISCSRTKLLQFEFYSFTQTINIIIIIAP